MIYGYCRVSTKGQAKDGNSLAEQERKLKEAGATKIFKDSFTGTKANRPEFSKLLNEIAEGDTLVVCKLDRFARSAKQGIELIDSLIAKGVTINVLDIGIIDNTPIGKFVRTVLFAVAEFERDMIVERTTDGKTAAREKEGFTEGRPQKFDAEQISNALDLLEDHSYTQVAKLTGISKSTLIRAKKVISR